MSAVWNPINEALQAAQPTVEEPARARGTARNAVAKPVLRLIRGDSVPIEPVHWLWRGYLPTGLLTILGGAPGCGKTTIALSLAATVTRGSKWPDGTSCVQAGDVVIWSGEDPQTVLAARLRAAGADVRRVHFIDGISSGDKDDKTFDPARDMQLLESAVSNLNARLLIVDPIVSAVAGDSHKNAEVRRALQPIVDLGQRMGCAVLGITHFTKGTAGRDPVERITGSLAFVALARLVLIAAKERPEPGSDEEPPRMLVRAKSNVGPDDGGFAYSLERKEVAHDVEGQCVRWLEALDGSARELLGEAEAEPAQMQDDNQEKSASDEASEFLQALLAAGPVQGTVAKKLMTGEGFSIKVTRRAREKLNVKVHREGFGKETRSIWSLPSLPLVPTDSIAAHRCPQQDGGHEGARVEAEGTNAGAEVGFEELVGDDVAFL